MLSRLFSFSRKTSEEASIEVEGLLHEHTCLITGASRGIGEHIAMEFAQQGATLILAAQDDKNLKNVAEKCRELGAVSCYSYSVNLASREGVDNFANEVLKNHGPIHVLVNNAGIASSNGLTALKGDPEEWEQVSTFLSSSKIIILSLSRWLV